VFLFDHDLRYLLAEGEGLAGLPREAFVGRHLREVLPAETYDLVEPLCQKALVGTATVADVQYRDRIYTVRTLPITDEAGVVTSGMAMTQDITARVLIEEERARLLANERVRAEQIKMMKLLMREAHHRIKNNLQAISDLLYLEGLSAGTNASSALQSLRNISGRISAIALVHEQLSQDTDMHAVDMQVVAQRLVPMVLGNMNAAGESQPTLEMEVAPLPLSSKAATALALILCELVSNACKHAIIGREKARLEVGFGPADGGLLLRVKDNGPGLPAGFDPVRDANVGLQVVRTLAERDLKGRLMLRSEGGMMAEVWLPTTEVSAADSEGVEA
jgi:two-component sensor histidine kinase